MVDDNARPQLKYKDVRGIYKRWLVKNHTTHNAVKARIKSDGNRQSIYDKVCEDEELSQELQGVTKKFFTSAVTSDKELRTSFNAPQPQQQATINHQGNGCIPANAAGGVAPTTSGNATGSGAVVAGQGGGDDAAAASTANIGEGARQQK